MSKEPILLRPGGNVRPRYLLERQDGLVVPLVPADELPEHTKLSVKRTMTIDEAFALGIQVVTLEPPKPERPATVEHPPAPQCYQYERPKTRFANAARNNRVPQSAEVNSASDSDLDSGSRGRTTQASSTSTRQYRQAGDPMKRYCSYWIHHGSCDFEQQGCKFLHQMPDQATLQSIGFRTTPRWWLDQNSSGRSRSVKKHDAGPKTAKSNSRDRAHFQTYEARNTRSTVHRRASAASMCESAQSDLIELEPELRATPFATPVTLNCTSPVQSGPLTELPSIPQMSNLQRRTALMAEKHAVHRESSLRYEAGREPDRACLVRYKGGRQEAWVPEKVKEPSRCIHRRRTAANRS